MRQAFNAGAGLLRQAWLPRMVSDNVATSACGKSKEIRQVFDVGAVMLSQALVPSMVSYTAVLSLAIAESLAAFRSDAAPRPPARRDHLQRFDQ